MLPSTAVSPESASAIACGFRQVKSEPELVAETQQSVPETIASSPPPPPSPIIDTSTPETLERDFHAWLKGEQKTRRSISCSETGHVMYSPIMKGEFSPLANDPPVTDFKIFQPFLTVDARRISLPSVHFKEESLSLLSAGQSPSSSSHSSESSPPLQQIAHKKDSDGKNKDEDRIIVLAEIGALPKASTAEGGLLAESPGSRSSGVNQLGRTYSPGLPLSMSERQQIVELHQSGWKICDISKYLCVTHSCVSKILQRYRTTGSVRPKDAKEGRQESPLVAAIRDYRLRLGIVRQSEIREQLIRDGLCRKENAPSRSSINHILRTKLNLMDFQQQKKRETNE